MVVHGDQTHICTPVGFVPKFETCCKEAALAAPAAASMEVILETFMASAGRVMDRLSMSKEELCALIVFTKAAKAHKRIAEKDQQALKLTDRAECVV